MRQIQRWTLSLNQWRVLLSYSIITLQSDRNQRHVLHGLSMLMNPNISKQLGVRGNIDASPSSNSVLIVKATFHNLLHGFNIHDMVSCVGRSGLYYTIYYSNWVTVVYSEFNEVSLIKGKWQWIAVCTVKVCSCMVTSLGVMAVQVVLSLASTQPPNGSIACWASLKLSGSSCWWRRCLNNVPPLSC